MNYLLQKIKPVLCVMLLSITLSAQNLDDFKAFKSKDGLFGAAKVVRDGAGNTYVAGLVADSTDIALGQGSHSLYHFGGMYYDGYVAKYSPTFKLLWVNSIGYYGVDEVTDIALAEHDSSIIVVGDFQYNAIVQGTGGNGGLQNLGSSDGFYVKYDSTGRIMFSRHIGGPGSDKIDHIVISGDQFVTTGTFDAGQCYFDEFSSNTVLGLSGSPNSFIAWYTLNTGTLTALDTFLNSTLTISAITADRSSNVYVTGYFSGNANLNPDGAAVTVTANGGYDAVLAKYDNQGGLVWHDEIGGSGNDFGKAIKFDGTDLAWAISFQNQIDVDPGAGTQLENSISNADGFFGRYDVNGAFSMGVALASSTTGATGITDIACNFGTYYITGYYVDSAVFDGIGLNYLNAATRAGFIAAYNNAGSLTQLISSHNGPGNNTNSEFDRIAGINNFEYISVSGVATGPVGLDCNDTANTYDFGANQQVFIAQYDLLAVKPTVAATLLTFSNVTNHGMTVTFTKGGGAKRIVVAHKASAVDTIPSTGVYYSADANFAVGTDLGGGNYVVYNDTGNTVNVSGLDSQTVYYYAVFEYNGVSQQINYQTAAYLAGHQQTMPYSTIGITEINNGSCRLYPNPIANKLYINVENAQPQTISIYDLNGALITSVPFKPETDLSQLSSGIYFVEIKSDTEVTMKKIVKM